MFVIGRVLFFDTTAALPSYGAGRLISAILTNGFADRIDCSAPTAVCSRTINAPWPMCCALAFPCADRKSTLSDRTARVASRSLTSRQSRIEGKHCRRRQLLSGYNGAQTRRGGRTTVRLYHCIKRRRNREQGSRWYHHELERRRGAHFWLSGRGNHRQPITTLIPPDHQNEEETILGRIGRGERVEHYQTIRQRKDGSLIDVSLTISPVRNAQGKVIGASKIARDITEHKRSEAQIINLAREAEHRTKNILATVLATVRLSRADTSDDLKQLIEGRINALAKVHGLFVQSRWAGAELHTLVTQELSPYRGETEARVRIDGPPVCWSRIRLRRLQFLCMNSQPTQQNTDRYRQRMVALKSLGPARQTDGSVCAGLKSAGRPSRRPRTAGSAHALWKT